MLLTRAMDKMFTESFANHNLALRKRQLQSIKSQLSRICKRHLQSIQSIKDNVQAFRGTRVLCGLCLLSFVFARKPSQPCEYVLVTGPTTFEVY